MLQRVSVNDESWIVRPTVHGFGQGQRTVNESIPISIAISIPSKATSVRNVGVVVNLGVNLVDREQR